MLQERGVISVIFLDAGGVILDETEFETVKAGIITALLSTVHPGYTLADYWRDTEDAVRRFAPSTYNYVIWKNTGDLDRYTRIRETFDQGWKEAKPPFTLTAGLPEVLEALSRSRRLGLLGQYGADFKDFLEAQGLLRFFTYADTQEKFTLTKPDPRYFEQVLGAAGVRPGDCLMVGDRIDKDIIPAKQVGMKTVRLRTGLHRNQEPRTPEEMPDVEIGGLKDLPDASFF